MIDVFFRGRDNHLYQKSFDGSMWQNLVDLGSGLHSDIAVSTWVRIGLTSAARETTTHPNTDRGTVRVGQAG
jgi:hypothetical protein